VRTLIALAGAVVAGVLVLPVAVIGVPFWILATLTDFLHGLLQRLQPGVLRERELWRYEPEVGWKPLPHLRAHSIAMRPWRRGSTDAEGWRGSHSIEESDLIVFGDSFAFGFGADDAMHFTSVPQRVRVKAIGANAYNLVQELIWMERLADRLGGRSVAWFVYYGNDLFDNLQPNFAGYRTPFVQPARNASWELVTSHVSQERWKTISWTEPRYKHRLVDVCENSDFAARAYSACEFILSRGKSVCERAGAPLAVIGIPEMDQLSEAGRAKLKAASARPAGFDADLPDRRIRESCMRLGLPFVALSEVLTEDDYSPIHDHWRPGGHRRVAERLSLLHDELRRSIPRD
jgi:hypothetical protein